MIVADYVGECRVTGNCMSSESSGDDRRFNASGVQPAGRPVTCNRQIVVRIIQRRDAVFLSAWERKDISVARINVSTPELSIEARLTVSGMLLQVSQQLPSELARLTDCARPQLTDLVVEKVNRVAANLLAPLRLIVYVVHVGSTFWVS